VNGLKRFNCPVYLYILLIIKLKIQIKVNLKKITFVLYYLDDTNMQYILTKSGYFLTQHNRVQFLM